MSVRISYLIKYCMTMAVRRISTQKWWWYIINKYIKPLLSMNTPMLCLYFCWCMY